MELPPKNDLIPHELDFHILPRNQKYSFIPKLIKQWKETDVWYKKDDHFNTKAIVSMKIYADYGFDVQGRLFTIIWHRILQ